MNDSMIAHEKISESIAVLSKIVSTLNVVKIMQETGLSRAEIVHFTKDNGGGAKVKTVIALQRYVDNWRNEVLSTKVV
jgi:hypothetical protein